MQRGCFCRLNRLTMHGDNLRSPECSLALKANWSDLNKKEALAFVTMEMHFWPAFTLCRRQLSGSLSLAVSKTDQNIFIAGHRKVPLSRDPPHVTSSCQRSKCKKDTGTTCHFFVLSWELNHVVWLWKKTTALYISPIMQNALSFFLNGVWPQLPIYKTSLIPCCRGAKESFYF